MYTGRLLLFYTNYYPDHSLKINDLCKSHIFEQQDINTPVYPRKNYRNKINRGTLVSKIINFSTYDIFLKSIRKEKKTLGNFFFFFLVQSKKVDFILHNLYNNNIMGRM